MFLIVKEKIRRRDVVFSLLVAALCVVLVFLPTGFENALYANSQRAKAVVTEVDNARVHQFGIVKEGAQHLRIKVESGPFTGQEMDADNLLVGKLELDKIFQTGDQALVVLDVDPATHKIIQANVMDHYRLDVELLLFGLFIAVLLFFSGWTGAKAVLSFFFTALMVWKVLVPAFLHGVEPIGLSLGTVTLLILVTTILVGGLSKKGIVAFLGALAGILFTCLISLVFSGPFHLNGAVRPFSESLLFSGYSYLSLSGIFIAGIFLASCGALMDISMDIAASLEELKRENPDIGPRALVQAGFRIGRAVIGTMTTTLLLAYSGGYTSLLMVFTAQGIPMENLFNISYVSSEIFHTIVGSFGLVLVAPCTAVIGALVFGRTKGKRKA